MRRLSTRKLATLQTYDPGDCTASGWDIAIYADGHLSAEYRTRWQGHRSGDRYVTDAGYIDTDVDVDNFRLWLQDTLHATATWLHSDAVRDSSLGDHWRQTRRGYIVR